MARKKKANAGTFKPGPDPRRHVFTTEERRRGYKVATENVKDPNVAAWLFRRVRGYYRAKKRAS